MLEAKFSRHPRLEHVRVIEFIVSGRRMRVSVLEDRIENKYPDRQLTLPLREEIPVGGFTPRLVLPLSSGAATTGIMDAVLLDPNDDEWREITVSDEDRKRIVDLFRKLLLAESQAKGRKKKEDLRRLMERE